MGVDEKRGARTVPATTSPLRLVSAEPLELAGNLVTMEQLRLALREEIREEIAPKPSRRVFELAGEWLPHKLRKIPGSADTFAARVRDHLLPELGHHTSITLLPRAIETWMDELLDTYAEQTVNHCRDAGRQLVDWAIRDGKWHAPNPFALVPPLKVPNPEKDVMSPAETATFLRYVADRWRNLFAVAIYLGPRKGELLAMHRQWVSLEQLLISFRGSHDRDVNKDGKRRLNIPVPTELAPYLEEQLARSRASEFLFPREDGGRLTKDTKLVDVATEALIKAGIFDADTGAPRAITFHGLRRVSSSLHQEAGCHPWVVSKVLGHSQQSLIAAGNVPENTTAKRYTKFSQEFIRQELSKLSLKPRS